MNTITFTPVTVGAYSLAQINAYFAAVATVLNAKMDVRGFTSTADITVIDGGIINVLTGGAHGTPQGVV